MRSNRALVVMPSYNEEKNIGKVLEAVLALHLDIDILVVNDGSQDATEVIARHYPVYVLCHPCNLGYGTALQTGYRFAVQHDYDYVVQFDSDGQHHAEDLKAVLVTLRTTGADFVIGSRFAGNKGFHPGALKMFAIRVFRSLILLCTRTRVSDPTSGLRGLSAALFTHYARSSQFPADFPDADFVIEVLLGRWKCREIPIRNSQRDHGRSMHSGWTPIVYMGKVVLSIFAVVLMNAARKRGIGIE